MFSYRASLTVILGAAIFVSPTFATRTHKTTAAPTAHAHTTKRVTSAASSRRRSRGRAKTVAKSHVLHGQQAIDAERVTQIQQALIRQHYMTGEATGQWDAGTIAAMQKYQGDQGWQTKLMPDSRALMKLGLGPDYSSAINAKDASFGPPPPVTTIPSDEAAGFAAAAKVNQ